MVMYWLGIADILFLLKCLKKPTEYFDVFEFIGFSGNRTCSGIQGKLQHKYSRTSRSRHFYFTRIVRLWNAPPVLDTTMSLPSLKLHLAKFFWNNFLNHFDTNNICTFHFYVLVAPVLFSHSSH